MSERRQGPLSGVRVLELGGVGPVAFCGMYFADLGGETTRIERPLGTDALSLNRQRLNLCARGKRSIVMDLRAESGRNIALDLIASADIVLEGFRPGVLERLDLGPAACLARNPALVFGRMSGWGEGGPLSNVAAHDINYLSMSGLLATIGPKAQPMPPLNIVGDFGGALYLVAGLLAALMHARATGQGQVVEASILGGSIGLMAQLYAIHDHGDWRLDRESNWMDGGAPFYRTYATADGNFMAVGAIEPQFYAALLNLLGLEGQIDPGLQMDRTTWASTAEAFAAAFRARSRDAWIALAKDTDACCTPVLDLDEARTHPHAREAALFVDVGGRTEPAPQPRFSVTPTFDPKAASSSGADAEAILRSIGRDEAAIRALYDAGVVIRPSQAR